MLGILATTDIMRHRASIDAQATIKYSGVPTQDTCIVLDYVDVDAPGSPDVQIQRVPIEGTQWTQYLRKDPHTLRSHYERRRQGKHSTLILMQCGFPRLEILHAVDSLESETYNYPVTKTEHLRSSAFDPDGTRLSSKPDMYDEVLRRVDIARSEGNRWLCLLPNEVEGDMRQVDIFEAVKVIQKDVMRV